MVHERICSASKPDISLSETMMEDISTIRFLPWTQLKGTDTLLAGFGFALGRHVMRDEVEVEVQEVTCCCISAPTLFMRAFGNN